MGVKLAGLRIMVLPARIDGKWQIGVLSSADAISGLANEGVVTIAVLFVVVAGMCESGALQLVSHRLLGN